MKRQKGDAYWLGEALIVRPGRWGKGGMLILKKGRRQGKLIEPRKDLQGGNFGGVKRIGKRDMLRIKTNNGRGTVIKKEGKTGGKTSDQMRGGQQKRSRKLEE